MLNEENYEVLKSSFINSQRLFNKLNVVANNVANIDYDESGLYQEEEDMYQRHWLKLSSKVTDALQESMADYKVELIKNDSLDMKELSFNLIKNDEKSKIKVEYSDDDSLNIIQVS